MKKLFLASIEIDGVLMVIPTYVNHALYKKQQYGLREIQKNDLELALNM